jgi:hypothetical protein
VIPLPGGVLLMMNAECRMLIWEFENHSNLDHHE